MRNAQIALSSGAVAEKMGSWGNMNSTYAGKSAVSRAWGSQPSARQAWKTFESGEWEPPFVEVQVAPDTPLNYCKCMTACGKFKCQNRVCPPDPASGRNFLWCYDCSEGQCECTCKICPKKCGCHRCVWSTSELNPSAPAECSIDLSPALEPIFNILFAHPGRLSVLSRKTCKAICKSFLDRTLFSHNNAFSVCYCTNCGMALAPSVRVCCCGVQQAVWASALPILWARLSSLLFSALKKNADVPLFTESCLILTGSCVNIGEIFRDVTASNNLSLSKFQVCCLSPAYAEQNAPADLLPFIHYLRFWCGVFVKMDGGSALEYSEEFIEIMDIAGDLLSNILRKNASIQVYRGTVDVNQKMNRIFLLQCVCVSFHTELLRKFPVALRLPEVVQKDPTSIKCLFDKMFGASSKIAWKLHPKDVSCIYLHYLVAIWVKQASVVSCSCPPRGGWGNQSGPGKDCRAPFKCRLLKAASSSRPPGTPHSWSDSEELYQVWNLVIS